MGCGSFFPNAKLDVFCRSWVIISDFPLGSNGDLGTTHSSPHEELDLRVYFWLVLNHTYSAMELCKMKTPAHTAILGTNCARSFTYGERRSTPGIGVYQDKDLGREAKCRNSALEEFKPRHLNDNAVKSVVNRTNSAVT
ncbi:hypothetical protein ACB092_10G172400 [Castanea dentata]